jgi:hypothetical protein
MAIIGAHVLIYSSDAEATRAALRDVFGFDHIDAGQGWLIFALPPAELGVHPVDHPAATAGDHAVSLMCDDIHAAVRDLRARGLQVKGEPADQGYGITVMVTLPGDVDIQVYEPRHPLAIPPQRPV